MPQKFWAVRYLETISPKKRTVESIVSLIYYNMILLITYLLQFGGTFHCSIQYTCFEEELQFLYNPF